MDNSSPSNRIRIFLLLFRIFYRSLGILLISVANIVFTGPVVGLLFLPEKRSADFLELVIATLFIIAGTVGFAWTFFVTKEGEIRGGIVLFIVGIFYIPFFLLSGGISDIGMGFIFMGLNWFIGLPAYIAGKLRAILINHIS